MSDQKNHNNYSLTARDGHVLTTAERMLEKLIKSDLPSPAELISLARLRYVIHATPRVVAEQEIKVILYSPHRLFGDHKINHWWEVCIDSGEIHIQTGGRFYRPSSGGDTFSCIMWSIAEGGSGDYIDNSEHHSIVDDLAPFADEVESMDFTEEDWRLELIGDEGNDLITDEHWAAHCEEHTEDERASDFTVTIPPPISRTEEILVSHIDLARALKTGNYVSLSEECFFCKSPAEKLNHLLDGSTHSGEWGWMCPECWSEKGADLGWGKAQLFTRQPSGKFVLTSGFPPEEDEE